MEESEDENTNTSKTFVHNNDRCMDSTSTGCVESEAIMGVTKTLMASNDTLFNLEDTLCDENLFSPRANSQNENKTPTNPEPSELPFALKYPLNSIPSKSDTNVVDILDLDLGLQSLPAKPPTSLPPFIDRLDVNDVLSPDQDLTFTVEEKTCITVKYSSGSQKDDERISEISEPDLVSSSLGGKTEDDDDLTSIEEDLPNDAFRPRNDVETVILDSDSDSDTTPKAHELHEAPENENSSENTSKDCHQDQLANEKCDDRRSEKSNDGGGGDGASEGHGTTKNDTLVLTNGEHEEKGQKDETVKEVQGVVNGDKDYDVKDADYWNICDKIYHETVDKVSNASDS